MNRACRSLLASSAVIALSLTACGQSSQDSQSEAVASAQARATASATSSASTENDVSVNEPKAGLLGGTLPKDLKKLDSGAKFSAEDSKKLAKVVGAEATPASDNTIKSTLDTASIDYSKVKSDPHNCLSLRRGVYYYAGDETHFSAAEDKVKGMVVVATLRGSEEWPLSRLAKVVHNCQTFKVLSKGEVEGEYTSSYSLRTDLTTNFTYFTVQTAGGTLKDNEGFASYAETEGLRVSVIPTDPRITSAQLDKEAQTVLTELVAARQKK